MDKNYKEMKAKQEKEVGRSEENEAKMKKEREKVERMKKRIEESKYWVVRIYDRGAWHGIVWRDGESDREDIRDDRI